MSECKHNWLHPDGLSCLTMMITDAKKIERAAFFEWLWLLFV